MLSQCSKKVKFKACEFDKLTIGPNLAAGSIDAQVFSCKNLSLTFLSYAVQAAQGSFNAGDQLARAEWLGELVVRPDR